MSYLGIQLKIYKYDYKLSMVSLVDSEVNTRLVVFIWLGIKKEDFVGLIKIWHDSFQIWFSPFVFAGGDQVMNAAITELDNSIPCKL